MFLCFAKKEIMQIKNIKNTESFDKCKVYMEEN